MKEKFCIFCGKDTEKYYICQPCLMQKAQKFLENVSKLRNSKERKRLLFAIKQFRYFSLVNFSIMIGIIFLAIIFSFPYLWRSTKNIALELRLLTLLFLYLFNIIGLYYGLKIYPKFMKSPLFLSRIFYKDYDYDYKKFFRSILLETLFPYKNLIFLFWKFFPFIIIGLIFFFLRNYFFNFLRYLPFHPYIKMNLALWICGFIINFYLGLLLIGPSLYDFLYTDWIGFMVKKTEEFYLSK